MIYDGSQKRQHIFTMGLESDKGNGRKINWNIYKAIPLVYEGLCVCGGGMCAKNLEVGINSAQPQNQEGSQYLS